MQRHFLLLLACVLLTFSATAQTAVAKIKYEEAEEAFTQGEYANTLERLNEAEKILGASNPRILYLRIMAADKVVQADPYTNFDLLQDLRKYCGLYLTKYENLENNEDKYRDVYKVGESLKKLPLTQADVNKHIEDTQAQVAERQAKLEQSKAFVNALADKYKFKAGLTAKELMAINPDVQDFQVVGSDFYTRKVKLKDPIPLGAWTFTTNAAGKVTSYSVCIASAGTRAEQSQAFSNFVADVRSNVSSDYITQTDVTRRMTPQELEVHKKTVAELGDEMAVGYGVGAPSDNNLEVNVPNTKALINIVKYKIPYKNPVVLLKFSNPD